MLRKNIVHQLLQSMLQWQIPASSLIKQNGFLCCHFHFLRMDVHSLELVELKQLAKARRIKHYYIKKKAELIQLLSMATLPEKYIIEKKTIAQLRDEAKERGLSGFYMLNRQAIAELLYPQTCLQQNNQNNNCAKKHDSPQKHNAD